MGNFITYSTDNLAFVASAILHGDNEIRITGVRFRDKTSGVKIYYLEPREKVIAFQLKYASDQIKISPGILTSKISEIKHLPAKEEI